jgi:hypothetical protein
VADLDKFQDELSHAKGASISASGAERQRHTSKRPDPRCSLSRVAIALARVASALRGAFRALLLQLRALVRSHLAGGRRRVPFYR